MNISKINPQALKKVAVAIGEELEQKTANTFGGKINPKLVTFGRVVFGLIALAVFAVVSAPPSNTPSTAPQTYSQITNSPEAIAKIEAETEQIRLKEAENDALNKEEKRSDEAQAKLKAELDAEQAEIRADWLAAVKRQNEAEIASDWPAAAKAGLEADDARARFVYDDRDRIDVIHVLIKSFSQ
jgi:hypothetical protein